MHAWINQSCSLGGANVHLYSTHGCLGHKSAHQNGISIGSSVSARLTGVPNTHIERHPDHTTLSVAIHHICAMHASVVRYLKLERR